MHRRQHRDATFFAGALYRGYGFTDGAAAIHSASGVNLATPLGSRVDTSTPLVPQFSRSGAQILQSYLAREWDTGPVTAHIETRDNIPNENPALFHLVWAPRFTHNAEDHPADCWDYELIPVTTDVRAALDRAHAASPDKQKLLKVAKRAHLSAALAIGFSFREATGWNMDIQHNDAPGRRAGAAKMPAAGHSPKAPVRRPAPTSLLPST